MIATALLAVAVPMASARAQDTVPTPGPAAAPVTAAPAAAPAAISYVQRGVPAEATAENGVIARERAFVAGRRAAWDRIASAAGVTRQLSDAQIESMVASIIIEEERTSPTRYAGRITVNFVPSRVRAITGSAVADGGGTPGPAPAGTAPDGDAPPRPAAPVPVASTVEAVALYGSLNEWLELRRRLRGQARIEVTAISTDRARLRLGLRTAPGVAAQELAQQGITLVPGSGAPGDAWRVALAGRS
ncbi:hypothetical protein GWK16_03965 [Roseomonas sp. JC162]|uniref:SPOR domain-containing protein n=1 Tax=Neoroseomonas marina TaxID=1232220 RepID=A0A848EA87_9PROT|nr:hypothetical protein [Neoroseomonas marina]NMJ40383.1 hypothetical protein [Neoroseomonas marina]